MSSLDPHRKTHHPWQSLQPLVAVGMAGLDGNPGDTHLEHNVGMMGDSTHPPRVMPNDEETTSMMRSRAMGQ